MKIFVVVVETITMWQFPFPNRNVLQMESNTIYMTIMVVNVQRMVSTVVPIARHPHQVRLIDEQFLAEICPSRHLINFIIVKNAK